MSTTASSHPEFPNGTQVIMNYAKSKFFGQRGVIVGSGPSPKRPDNDAAKIYIRWPSGDTFEYFPRHITFAPKPLNEYQISNKRTHEGKKILIRTIHEVPASTRPRPTIFDQVAARKATGAESEE